MSRSTAATPDLLPVFNALPGANLLLTPDWVIVGASDDYLAATLTQRATLVGQFIFDAFPDNPQAPQAQAVASVRAALTAVLATRLPHTMAPQHYDVPDPARPGQFVERHWLPVHTPVLDAAGQVQFIIQSVQDLTASHLAARQLHESQAREQVARADAEAQRQRLYEFMSAAPGVVLSLVGPQHVIEFANEGFRQQFGVPDPVGKTYLETLPGAADQYAPQYQATDLYDHVYRTGEPYYAAEAPYYIDGPTSAEPRVLRYFTFSVQAARAGDGRITGVQAYATDVTEQVRARQQVQQSNEELEARVQARTQELAQVQAEAETQRQRLHQLVVEAPALIASLRGPTHVVELANDGFRAIFGGRELVGKPYREAIPEFADQPFFDLLDAVYRTGETYYGREELVVLDRTNSGQLEHTFLTYTYQATRDAQGRVDGILVFCYEVTDQVLARQEREDAGRQLARVFEQAPVAVAVLQGPDYRIEVANARVAELWGRTPAQVLGRPLFEALPEVRGQGFQELLDQVVATGEAFVAQEVSAVLQRQGQLETVCFNFVYQPLRNAQGAIGSVVIVAVDVTAQVRAHQQVQELNAQLQARNAELDTANQQLTRTNVDLDNFVYTASHDLKAPIANLEGLLTSLRQELPTPTSEVAFLLELMQDSIARFTHTLALLTDVTKLQHAFSNGPAPVALAPLIEDVRLDLAPLLQQVGGHLHVDVAAAPTLTCSEKNLRSVVHNLLSNAFKYHDPTRPAVVTVRSHLEDAYLVLEVQDNGLGLDLSGAPELFGLFRRFHTHVEGSGVGLHMVKKLVENEGGKIEVASHLGHGTTFTVYFPC
ncbi:MAG: PAS domain-containing protein [Cytophagaceae bacterium]|nr:MAG: PAS domain-containing protein [Cytophagaceae bacterium]